MLRFFFRFFDQLKRFITSLGHYDENEENSSVHFRYVQYLLDVVCASLTSRRQQTNIDSTSRWIMAIRGELCSTSTNRNEMKQGHADWYPCRDKGAEQSETIPSKPDRHFFGRWRLRGCVLQNKSRFESYLLLFLLATLRTPRKKTKSHTYL
jgi:hypothetical protein